MKETNKWICASAYIFFFIPLIADSENQTYKFHANQGLLIALMGVATVLLGWIPIIGWILAIIAPLVLLVFAIIGIVNALNENEKELPLVGSMRIIK